VSPSTRRHGVRSAEIGREAETAVVAALVRSGFPGAERHRVRHDDRLDITVCPGVLASVKGGQAAKSASLGAVLAWRTEAEQKRIRHGAAATLLVVQRNGYGRDRAAAWRCWVLGLGRDAWETTLADAAHYLRDAGYGDPITTTEGTP
jgi:hypothetical protein